MASLPRSADAAAEMSLQSVVETALCFVAAMVVLRLEMQRRAGEHYAGGAGLGGAIGGCKKILVHCAPEVAGVVVCLTLAALLRARGDVESHDDMETWEEIKRQWPLLLTADTLLSLQAMLRFVVLLSLVLRANTRILMPLSDEVAALSCAGNLSRCFLLGVSKTYMLDGPLGGNLPAGFEMGAVPLLLALGSFKTLRRCPLTLVSVFCGVSWLAARHHLNMADEKLANELFLAAHMFDTLAALTYLVRSLMIGVQSLGPGSAVIGFTHILMATQASLATFFFLQAFDADLVLVGAGLPFEALHVCVIVQLGAYLGALAVFVTECLQEYQAGGNVGATSEYPVGGSGSALEYSF